MLLSGLDLREQAERRQVLPALLRAPQGHQPLFGIGLFRTARKSEAFSGAIHPLFPPRHLIPAPAAAESAAVTGGQSMAGTSHSHLAIRPAVAGVDPASAQGIGKEAIAQLASPPAPLTTAATAASHR